MAFLHGTGVKATTVTRPDTPIQARQTHFFMASIRIIELSPGLNTNKNKRNTNTFVVNAIDNPYTLGIYNTPFPVYANIGKTIAEIAGIVVNESNNQFALGIHITQFTV